MGYTLHEMNVLLFSKEDTVFGDTEITSGNDNEWNGDGDYEYGDDDNPSGSFDW